MDYSLSIRDLLGAFFRRYRLFRKVFILVVLFGIANILFSQKLYQANGSLLVKFGADAESGVNKPNNNMPLPSNDRKEIMESNIEILQSHDLLESIIKKIGIQRLYSELSDDRSGYETAIKKLNDSHLSVKSPTQSNIIEISILNKDPEVAAEFVSDLQEAFITKQLEVFNKPQTEFIEEQIKQAYEKLQKSQKELRDFKATTGISSLEDELNELLKQKSNAAAIAVQSLDDTKTKLSELKDKEAELLATYKPDSPEVSSVRKSIAEVARQISEKQTNVYANSVDSELASQNASINARIAVLEEKRGQYDDLVRKVHLDEENHKNYLARSEEARVNATLGEKKITSISVVDRPIVPIKPAKPRKLLILAASVLLGVILGIALIALSEVLDESFRTPKQLEKNLGLPVFACFPSKNELMQLLVTLGNKFASETPILQFVSCYENEGVEKLASDLVNLANQMGKTAILVTSKELYDNVAKNKGKFDFIVLANAGILRDALGQSISKQVSGTIMVVQAERTRLPVVKEAISLIQSQGGKVIGSVLLERKFYIPKHLYSLLYEQTSPHNNWKTFLIACLRFIRMSVTSLFRKSRAYSNRK